ncbi:NADP-dependent oxidoreductase domain-containing protein [Xylaria arbuscula]|nr:NADP-dependent oxidoreductase domain-containing protein [Xylaria arbuscula]
MSNLLPPSAISGKPVNPVGFGMMNLTLSGTVSTDDAIACLKEAVNNGANFWNGALFYGRPDSNSLVLLKEYFTKYPEDASKIFLSVKGAYDAPNRVATCDEASIREAVDTALHQLGRTHAIDLFECARIDPKVPVETMVHTLASLIKEGKIGSYGLSEVNAKTIRRAHAVHPCAGVEVEISLFSRDALAPGGVIDTCRELGIPVIGYSVLDRGWLTGQLKKHSDLAKDDRRHYYPRFQPEAFEHNVKLAQEVENVAKQKGVTPAQVAIAWVRQLGVLAIPGATKATRVKENCASKDVELTDSEMATLREIIDKAGVVGHRYPAAYQALLDG